MDIKGMGPAVVESLVKHGFITKISDIYRLKNRRDELILSNSIGKQKTVDNLLDAIEKSKSQDMPRLIKALGARNIGKHAGQILAEKYGSINALFGATYDDLVTLPDFGDTTAKAVCEFYSRPSIKELVAELESLGVNMKAQKAEKSSTKLNGMTFVITGTLPTLSRSEASELIKSNGGKVSGSVSKKTSYLLAGENAGSKLTKATELGISVISEEEHRNLLN